jgi:glycosyltransferase involved in cell wall biosynthesis
MTAPLVSIVTATYNRSNVLRLTIESALRSTLTDFELLVVGDCCTDDTAAVVASFADDRVRFVNLGENHGEQSVPNNEGVRLARGEYVAFLNHDDLWTPDHLATCVAQLEASGADLVFSMILTYGPDGRPFVTGASEGTYELWTGASVSSWLFRRELSGIVGPWRSAFTLYADASQEWLRRARKLGRKLVAVPRVTVVAVRSGSRKGCYADRELAFNAEIAAQLRDDPHFIEATLARIINDDNVATPRAIVRRLSGAMKLAVKRGFAAIGIHPTTFISGLRAGGRGKYIASLRRTRGLPALERNR